MSNILEKNTKNITLSKNKDNKFSSLSLFSSAKIKLFNILDAGMKSKNIEADTKFWREFKKI